MKYMETGGFQKHPFMRLTLLWTAFFLCGLWLTNFAMYFSRMGLHPDSVAAYYLGSETEFSSPKSFAAMLETTHAHLPIMGIVVLLLTHLLLFAPFSDRGKTLLIYSAFLSAFLNEAAGWLVRFVHPGLAIVKVIAFLCFQGVLGFLLLSLAAFLLRHARSARRKKSPQNLN